MKRFLIIAGLAVLAALGVGAVLYGKSVRFFSRTETVAFDPQLRIFLGGGGNSIVLTSEDGAKALVVDTKMGKSAKAMRAAIKADSIIVVNTHLHSDHTGGNVLYPGAFLISGAYTREQWEREAKSRYPDRALRPGEEETLSVGTERVRIRNLGSGHTFDDLVVYLENRKLLVTGDLVFRMSHPFLIEKDGCRVSSWIRALEEADSLFDVRTLVPGHGPVSDRSALSAMRDYFVSAGEAIGHPEKAAALQRKYRYYLGVPGMTGLSKTIGFIRRERAEGQPGRL